MKGVKVGAKRTCPLPYISGSAIKQSLQVSLMMRRGLVNPACALGKDHFRFSLVRNIFAMSVNQSFVTKLSLQS